MSNPNASYDIEALRTAAATYGATPDMIDKFISFVLDRYDSGPALIIEYEKNIYPPIVYARKTSSRGGSLVYNADEVFGK